MNKDAVDFALRRCSELVLSVTADLKPLHFCSGSPVKASQHLFFASIGNLS